MTNRWVLLAIVFAGLAAVGGVLWHFLSVKPRARGRDPAWARMVEENLKKVEKQANEALKCRRKLAGFLVRWKFARDIDEPRSGWWYHGHEATAEEGEEDAEPEE